MKKLWVMILLLAFLMGGMGFGTMPKAEAEADWKSLPYWIGVDIQNQRCTIYSTEDNSVVHCWICSTGKKGYTTPVGVYYLPKAQGNERKEWFSFSASYVKWCVRYTNGLYFHSILYKKKDDFTIMDSSITYLGTIRSHGCIRLETQHAKWLCDNCPTGTKVVIHKGVNDSRIVNALGRSASTEMTPKLPAAVGMVKPTSVALDKSGIGESGVLTLKKGQTYTFTATMTPDDATDPFTWTSSYSKVASVKNGTVTALAEGKTTITVKTRNGRTDKVTVQVLDPYKPTCITLNESGTLKLDLGQKLELAATVTSKEPYDHKINWTSTSSKIAAVSSTGVVTPKKAGTVTITAKTENGLKASVKLQIVDPTVPTGIRMEQTGTVTLYIGVDGKPVETLQLSAEVQPIETANQRITWSSSGKRVATVNGSGLVTPVKAGTVTITAKTVNGKKAYVKVKVIDLRVPTGVTLDQTGTIELPVGSKLQLGATVAPDTAKANVKWYTSNKRYAKVSSEGIVTGIKPGTVTITVKTVNGKKATVKVKVVRAQTTPDPKDGSAEDKPENQEPVVEPAQTSESRQDDGEAAQQESGSDTEGEGKSVETPGSGAEE